MQEKKLNYNTKSKIINLAGSCFWYWNDFYSFLESCVIPSSIYKQFDKSNKYQVMRQVLELLERQKKYDLLTNIAREFYNLTPTADGIDVKKAKKNIEEFRDTMGNSLMEDEIKNIEFEKEILERKKLNEEKAQTAEALSKLKQRFIELQSTSEKQKRGYELEKLFYELLILEEFEVNKPYRPKGEQVDGIFRYEKFDYIVEIKWSKKPSSQSDLSIFDGKIRGKGQSTRGFFVSINGFEKNAIEKYSGDSPRIILMDGRDLFSILSEHTNFYDLMKLKTGALARKGIIYINFSNN